MEPNKESRMVKLADLAEKLIKVSAVLGAFGYMSLRAHLNYLGISSRSSLGVERYLMETYNLVATIFLPFFLIILCGIVGLIIIYPLTLVLRKIPKIKLSAENLARYFSIKSSTVLFPVLLVILVLIVYLWMFRVLSRSGGATDVAVGKLSIEQLKYGDADWLFYVICVVCVLGWALYSRYSPSSKQRRRVNGANQPRLVWIVFAFSIVVLALQLPILYGRLVRSTDYPMAQVQFENGGSQTICGLLILDSSSDLTLWRAESGIGEVIAIPHSKIQSIKTGRMVDLLAAASANAANPALYQPDCADLPKFTAR